MTKTIRLYAKEFPSKEGHKFLSYSAKLGDVWYKIKFRRECEDYPRKAGTYHITLNSEDCSYQKSEYGYNDIIWIKAVAEIKRAETPTGNAAIKNIFSGIPDIDELPC